MKVSFVLILLLGIVSSAYAKPISYTALDAQHPVVFDGKSFNYKDIKVELGPKAFFIDGRLSDEEVNQWPYVFSTVNEAVKHLSDGTEEEPMVLYLAPWVYWLDDPDDPAIRKAERGGTPYALEIKCEWLKFYGLSNDPQNVVLAVNRGQTIGALGNFTMLKIDGQGTASENITFGNYCNVDLEFPLNPQLNRKKRADAIVQAQLIHCNGDKILARNTRFISRLNLCPFVGGKRVLFDHCHFESTDDALCGTAVYLNSTLDFYSSKPFYNTVGTGAVFLNCAVHTMAGAKQHFTKANGQLAVIDTRISSDNEVYISWNDVTPPETRNYQCGVTVNGKAYFIGSQSASSTVDISNSELLKAYRFIANDSVVYNTYNLLKGIDDWDPMKQKEIVKAAEKKDATIYTDLPVQLKIGPTRKSIETGKDTLVLYARLFRFGNFPANSPSVRWRVDEKFESIVQLKPGQDGLSCQVFPTNQENEPIEVIVEASTKMGLEAACVVTIEPKTLPAPHFMEKPTLLLQDGVLSLRYKLDEKFKDQSLVTWYRCMDHKGAHAIKVAESREGKPYLNYLLTAADEGYYLMAEVAPKHIRSEPGAKQQVTTEEPISAKAISSDSNHLETDFRNIAVENQLKVLPGFWTFRPLATMHNGEAIPADTTKDAWYYGEGSQGNAGRKGLLQTGRSATMLYTPVQDKVHNMSLKMIVSPYKTAGQGFSIAPLYMDVLIKFDTHTMTGYGLRFQRTTKYGNAVDCYFVHYQKEKVTKISDAVSTSCYRTPCTIELAVEGNKLSAKAGTSKDYSNPKYPEVLPALDMSIGIDTNSFGGFGIQYNGGASTMINSIVVNWDCQ